MSSSPDSTAEGAGGRPERQFGWSNLFLPPENDPRDQRGPLDTEREILVRYLRHYRLTLELKCAGLDADQSACQAVPPSNLSLLGLIRHMASVEQFWFRKTMAGDWSTPRLFRERPDEDFDGAVADPDVVAEAWRLWRDEVAFAETFVAQAPSLDVTGDTRGGSDEPSLMSLRVLVVHMIEEYARHAGHADFLRERIDGRVGR